MSNDRKPIPSRQMALDAASTANLRSSLSARQDSVSSANLRGSLQRGASSANLTTALASRPAPSAQTSQPAAPATPPAQPKK